MQDHDHDTKDNQPASPGRRRIFQAAAAVGLGGTLPAAAEAAAAPKRAAKPAASLDAKLKANVKNVVVIYLENRSFNNLFANFPGLAAPMPAMIPQPSRPTAACSSGVSTPSTWVHCLAWTSVLSANAPMPRAGDSSVPSSRVIFWVALCVSKQYCGLPFRHARH